VSVQHAITPRSVSGRAAHEEKEKRPKTLRRVQQRTFPKHISRGSPALLALSQNPVLQCLTFDAVTFAVDADLEHGGSSRLGQSVAGILLGMSDEEMSRIEHAGSHQIHTPAAPGGLD